METLQKKLWILVKIIHLIYLNKIKINVLYFEMYLLKLYFFSYKV